jgi:hypothetical protein
MPGGSVFTPGSVNISGPVTATISGPVTVEGTIDIGNVPTVDLAAGATVDISGTADVNIQNASVDVVGAGGYIIPGQTATILNNTSAAITIGPGVTDEVVTNQSVVTYASLDITLNAGIEVNAGATTTATCLTIEVVFSDANGNYIANGFYNIPVGWNSTGAGVGQISIPCRGSLVTVSLINPGSTGTITIPVNGLNISGSFRVISKVQYFSYNGNSGTVNGIIYDPAITNNVNNVIPPWVAQINNPTLTSGDTYAFMLAGYAGEVTGFFRANGGTPGVAIVDLGSAGTIANIVAGVDQSGIIYSCVVAAAGDYQYLDFSLPPSPCAAIVSASGTESFNLQLMGKM